MAIFLPEDKNLPTLLHKAGEPTFNMSYATLADAVRDVKNWPESEQAKARFNVTKVFSWTDIEPYVAQCHPSRGSWSDQNGVT